MIITNNFVFLHMPKTGGTFMEAVLRRLRAQGLVDYCHESRLFFHGTPHDTYADIPPQFRKHWKLICLRNIADHYVSHFAFGWWRQDPAAFFNHEGAVKMLSPERATFAEFLRAWNDPDINHYRRDFGSYGSRYGQISYEWARYLSADPEAFLQMAMERGLDVLDYLHRERIFIVRQERLNQDLFAFLCLSGLPAKKVAFVLDEGRVLPPAHSQQARKPQWQSYFTAADRKYLSDIEEPAFRVMPEYRIGIDVDSASTPPVLDRVS